MPHDIRSAWFKTLGQLALILALAVVVGLLVGQIWPVVTVAALGVVAWHYWRLRKVLLRLTALFTVLAVEQIRAKRDWGALVLGTLSALVAGLWCPDYFLLAASLMLVLVLLVWPLKPEVTCDHA